MPAGQQQLAPQPGGGEGGVDHHAVHRIRARLAPHRDHRHAPHDQIAQQRLGGRAREVDDGVELVEEAGPHRLSLGGAGGDVRPAGVGVAQRHDESRDGAVSGIVGIREGDLATIERLIESDSITMEMYQERLDEILSIGQAADQEAAAGVSPAASEVLKVWDAMDAGLIKDEREAFDEAEKRVRERERGKAAE